MPTFPALGARMPVVAFLAAIGEWRSGNCWVYPRLKCLIYRPFGSFHKRLFVLASETFYDFVFCFLPRLPLIPAQRRIALFLPLGCSCFSMQSASMNLCMGAIDPFGWDWPSVFF